MMKLQKQTNKQTNKAIVARLRQKPLIHLTFQMYFSPDFPLPKKLTLCITRIFFSFFSFCFVAVSVFAHYIPVMHMHAMPK